MLITEGFAIKRIEFDIIQNQDYKINAIAYGEPLDFKKHNFIKAPTFYDMEIKQRRFLLEDRRN